MAYESLEASIENRTNEPMNTEVRSASILILTADDDFLKTACDAQTITIRGKRYTRE